MEGQAHYSTQHSWGCSRGLYQPRRFAASAHHFTDAYARRRCQSRDVGRAHQMRAMKNAAASTEQQEGGREPGDEGYTWPQRRQERSMEDAIKAIGLGTWRLRGRMGEPFEVLAAHMEGAWRHYFTMELKLHPLPEDLSFADSMDPERSMGSFSYIDVLDPPEGDRGAGWPRMLIENRAYATKVFRKLHMELATRQDGLQVLHCVLYPRLDYDMPILSIDMVGNASTGRVSLAIADPCPASMDRKLPPAYEQTIRQLQEVHGMESNRSVPEWGKAIFSDLCVIVRPGSAEELERFMLYTIALHQVHILLSKNAGPVTGSSEGERRLEDIRAAHQRYCQKQMENSKTSAVLQAAFTEDFARRYMSEVMFDAPPVVAALNSLE